MWFRRFHYLQGHKFLWKLLLSFNNNLFTRSFREQCCITCPRFCSQYQKHCFFEIIDDSHKALWKAKIVALTFCLLFSLHYPFWNYGRISICKKWAIADFVLVVTWNKWRDLLLVWFTTNNFNILELVYIRVGVTWNRTVHVQRIT